MCCEFGRMRWCGQRFVMQSTNTISVKDGIAV